MDNHGSSEVSPTSAFTADNGNYVTIPQSLAARSPSFTNTAASVGDLLRGIPSDVVGDSSPSLVAWFSSFVDMSASMASARANEPPPKLQVEDGFYELQDMYYLHHWRTHLLETLPAPFKQVESLVDRCPALRSAIIALSACDLAQSRTDVRSWTIKGGKRWLFSPNREHQEYGEIYYNISMHKLAKTDPAKQEPTSVLATLMLFIYIESHIGSFRGAAFHHHAIEHLLPSQHHFCEQSVLARDLVRTWTCLRAQNWRHRIPFTVLDFQKSLIDLGLSVEQLLDPSEARDEAIIINMLQSWRLSLMILFERYTGRGDMESISSRCCRDYYERVQPPAMTQPWRPKVPILDEDYELLLSEQRAKLDQWHAAVPPSHTPHFGNLGLKNGARHHLQVNQPPLKFHSHQAAMNYVYYIAARIFQSREGIDEFLCGPSVPPYHTGQLNPAGVDHWIDLLLRIVADLDVMACARHSSYSVGILEILHMCHLRLPRYSQVIGSCIDYLTESYANNCITHEGSTLILGFQHEFEEIEEQRNQGNDVFYVMPRSSPDAQRELAYDDTTPLVVYGRDRATGKFFCRLLPPKRKYC